MGYLIKNKTKILLTTVFLLFVFCLIFYFWRLSFIKDAQADSVKQSHDVIGVRVISKPGSDQFLSAKDWAAKNGFGGSDAMLVDGYRAVRSGRSIYVNAANVSGNDFFTNIYVLSYNQEPDQDTVEIYRQIVKHWKFNANLDTAGKCEGENKMTCQYDEDCAGFGFCDSEKAKVTRDTWRLEDLSSIRMAIIAYKEKNGAFPTFLAGTYVANNSISTWPSWQQEVEEKLGLKMPTDPINKLGPCASNFDPETCWDNLAKKYGAPISDGKVEFPAKSFAYKLWINGDGSSYKVCAYLEWKKAEYCFSTN